MCYVDKNGSLPHWKSLLGESMHDEYFGTNINVVDRRTRQLMEYSAWKMESPIYNIISFQLETAGAISMKPRTTTFVSVGVVVQKISERLEAVLGTRLVDYEGIDKEAV